MSQFYSKQDLDLNVKVLEDKVEFIMKSFSLATVNPLNPLAPPVAKSLLQVYYEVKSGRPLADAVEATDQTNEVSNVSVDEDSGERESQ